MSRRRLTAPALALATALALAGCSTPAAEPTAWQGQVQTLASQASGGDYASASATLDQLEADVLAQRDAGAIPSAEAEAILARIAAVRTDLASLAPAPAPTPEQSQEPLPEDSSDPTQDTVDDQQGTTVDDEEATVDDPREAPESDDKGPGNSGKGNDGKGKSEDAKGPGGPGKKDG